MTNIWKQYFLSILRIFHQFLIIEIFKSVKKFLENVFLKSAKYTLEGTIFNMQSVPNKVRLYFTSGFEKAKVIFLENYKNALNIFIFRIFEKNKLSLSNSILHAEDDNFTKKKVLEMLQLDDLSLPSKDQYYQVNEQHQHFLLSNSIIYEPSETNLARG